MITDNMDYEEALHHLEARIVQMEEHMLTVMASLIKAELLMRPEKYEFKHTNPIPEAEALGDAAIRRDMKDSTDNTSIWPKED